MLEKNHDLGDEMIIHNPTVVVGKVVDDFEDDEEFDEDWSSALDVLRSTSTFLEYLSNPLLCRAISQKERRAMGKLLEKIYEITNAEFE